MCLGNSKPLLVALLKYGSNRLLSLFELTPLSLLLGLDLVLKNILHFLQAIDHHIHLASDALLDLEGFLQLHWAVVLYHFEI